MRETRSLEFSLRELARRAGVSHNAPYKHFADKRELLAAVSGAGLEMLTKLMASEMAGLSVPREQLFAMLRAYIDHGVGNPALYTLMFGGYLAVRIIAAPRSNWPKPRRLRGCSRALYLRALWTRHPAQPA